MSSCQPPQSSTQRRQSTPEAYRYVDTQYHKQSRSTNDYTQTVTAMSFIWFGPLPPSRANAQVAHAKSEVPENRARVLKWHYRHEFERHERVATEFKDVSMETQLNKPPAILNSATPGLRDAVL
ncbi:hypothetical protein AVEN_13460-1 [Araneus ventricosus]|uniref:Uncharacterized protein n=1 Tax=Araneus ventricosus TaxID=182803 RepID=A0A4Y2PXK0_ARAVE|nr:hypothetical protein AVEN_13460-1 [Araneus ventricosus]